jgi:hypothetical protein
MTRWRMPKTRVMAVALLVAQGAPAGADDHASVARIESELAGTKLGSTTRTLQERLPGLYRHMLAMGEVLYEACNQRDLIVFTFTAAPWSPEFITDIEVRHEDDVTVCRDSTGALPDLALAPVTPRKVAIGVPVSDVLAKYGKPTEEKALPNGDRILRYRSRGEGYDPPIRNVLLVFWLREGKVRSFTLTGDVPGAKNPNSMK